MSEIGARALSQHVSFSVTPAVKSAIFIWLLVIATVGFYALGPTASWWPAIGIGWFYGTLVYLNTIHVALTPFVYFDKSSYRVISKYRHRFFIGVPAIYVSFFLFFLYSPSEYTLYFFIAFGWWSFWHFQKQHYGVFSFLNVYFSTRPSQTERLIILAATVPVMIALIPVTVVGRGTPENFIAGYADHLNMAALVVFCAVSLAGVILAIHRFNVSSEKPLQERIMMAASLLFFSTNYWPIIFIEPFSLAAVMTTGGHGLQYCVFMVIYAYQQPRKDGTKQPIRQAVRGGLALCFMFALGMGSWAVLVGWLPTQQSVMGLQGSPWTAALASVGIAITGTHYLMDAVLWKLSDEHARGLVREKYDFLFSLAK